MFDMHKDRLKCEVTFDEEDIFMATGDREQYKTMNWLWGKFYDSPKIYPVYSMGLVRELKLLQNEKKELNEKFKDSFDKLINFFNDASENNEDIITISDLRN